MKAVDWRPFVQYGFIWLLGDAEHPDLLDAILGQVNGICGAQAPGMLLMITGTHTGWVPIRVEVHDSPPDLADEWEEVVEVSVEIVPGDSYFLSTFDDGHEVPGLSPGWSRARYCALGMDSAREAEGDDLPAPDRYLLQLWPAHEAPESVIRQTSSYAEYWASVATGTEEEYAERGRQQVWSTEGIDPEAWGGSVPGQRLLKAGNHAPNVAWLDRSLADAVADLTDEGAVRLADWVRSRLGAQQTPESTLALDWMRYPSKRPVEAAFEALSYGHSGDGAPDQFLADARAFVATLSALPP